MSDNHAHHHHHHTESGNIKVAFFLNLFFTIVEIIGGILTNSMAILSDALHDLGDSLSLGLAWYFENVSKKERTKKYSYGYKRYGLIGALVNSIVLITGSAFIIYETIPRLIAPQVVDTKGMMLIAVIGILVNGLAVLKLKKGKSINQRVVYLHLLEDVLGWVAVLIGAIIMHFFHAPIIDPILSILISIFILSNVYRSLKRIIQIMMQGTPSEIELDKITGLLKGIPEITGFHDLHVWSMDGEYHVLTVHLIIEKNLTLDKLGLLKKRIRSELHELDMEHATLEFELKDEDCALEDC